MMLFVKSGYFTLFKNKKWQKQKKKVSLKEIEQTW